MGKFAKNLPNLITAFRILMTLPVGIALWVGAYSVALGLFFVAGVSDALDGLLARYWHCESRWGSLADPVADKVLLVVTFMVLALKGAVPLWLLFIILGRDLIILIGAVAYHFMIGRFTAQPTLLSKACTFFQIIFCLVIVLKLAGFEIPDAGVMLLQWMVVFTGVLSGLQYMWIWGHKSIEATRLEQVSASVGQKTLANRGHSLTRDA